MVKRVTVLLGLKLFRSVCYKMVGGGERVVEVAAYPQPLLCLKPDLALNDLYDLRHITTTPRLSPQQSEL